MLVYIQYEDGTIKYDVFVTGIAGCLLVGTVQKKKKKKKGTVELPIFQIHICNFENYRLN